MTEYVNKPIDMNSDYVKKVQAGILIPKVLHNRLIAQDEKLESIENLLKDIAVRLAAE
jgi:hypothetical protein